MRRILLLALAGLIVGAALGLIIGWRLWPVSYTNTTPSQLRQDYRNDYILMVAAEYQIEQDAAQALTRLVLLDPDMPSSPVVELAEQLIAADGNRSDITLLANLAEALGATSIELIPYLEDSP